jgi:hypothetical protein
MRSPAKAYSAGRIKVALQGLVWEVRVHPEMVIFRKWLFSANGYFPKYLGWAPNLILKFL